MKKLMALALALVVCLSLSVCAFADETPTEFGSFTKTYTVTGSSSTTVIYSPAEKLNFTVVATDAPSAYISQYTGDAWKTAAAALLTVETDGSYTTDGTQSSYSIGVSFTTDLTNIPVGEYYYTIEEVAGTALAVTYDKTSAISVVVYVTYVQDATGAYTTEKQAKVYLATDQSTDSTGKKVAEFTNTYALGELDITKVITGSLGVKTDEFAVKVTLTASSQPASTVSYTSSVAGVSYTDGSVSGTTVASGNLTWTANSDGTYSATVYVGVTNDTTVKFINVPVGVTYEVQELDYSGDSNAANAANAGYDTTYAVTTGETEDTVADSKDSVSGTIDDSADVVTITNTKDTQISTGVSLESLPYVLVLVAVLALGAVLVIRKRRVED
ncbi:MAG: hypothetical protein LUH42_01890 [Oscillospiraceae bacterium]|nr:hypothetical protein [Oscillospiraceae bacterium]